LVAALVSCNDDDNELAAGDLSAHCSAAPSSGQAPLAVAFSFELSGAGGPFSAVVNYGDGTTSTDPQAAHVYTSAGSYTVAFSARAGTRSASCTTSVSVSAPPGSGGPAGNQPANGVFKTTPPDDGAGNIVGPAPLEVRFNMCPSTDPDGDGLRFTMDFQSDGTLDVNGMTGADCRRSFIYPVGTFKARICVTDVDAATGAAHHPAECQVYTVMATP
jgi:hypothetical protein